MSRLKPADTVLSLTLVAVTLAIVIRLIPPMVDERFILSMKKNAEHITRIDQPRQIEATRTVGVDRLELIDRNRFAHPTLGPLGWGEDFFVDIDSRFTVSEAARYRFLVGSDDGFELRIDGQLVCRHPGDRPYSKQSCYRRLDAGEHRLELSYFQGYGNAGLTLEAGRISTAPRYWGTEIDGIEYAAPPAP